MADTHLVIFHIGPVQDFIATARRSRDLWYGSWMLSELSRAVARKVIELSGLLIFPVNPQSILNVPNKIVAIVEGHPKSFGKQVGETVSTRMKELGNEALDQVKTNNYDRQLAEAQIQNLPEFYWVSVPFDEKNYQQARERAEALMAARKTTRNFMQSTGSPVPKSSLDGARESVIPEEDYPKRDGQDRLAKIKKLYDNYHTRQGERLSGVDILKRLGNPKDAPKFKSTSDLAALPFLERVDRIKGKGKSRELIGKIRSMLQNAGWAMGEAEEELVFESRLADWIPAGKQQDTVRQDLSDLLKIYTEGRAVPNPYYALLAADGDNMGVVIDAQEDAGKHRDLSTALSEFAALAPEIVRAQHGFLIYSGGDDVLAYLPINNVLECARKLEEAFRAKIPDSFKASKGNQEIRPTLSIGIMIAHHLEPLSDVLEKAREAERAAKRVDSIQKNGLAITLCKRGGADRTVSGRWGAFDRRLKQLIEFSNSNAISAGTAYELQELHRILSGTSIPPEGLANESLRIIGRKQDSSGGKKVDEKITTEFRKWIVTDRIALNELAKEMIIAKMLASEAELPGEKEEVTL